MKAACSNPTETTVLDYEDLLDIDEE